MAIKVKIEIDDVKREYELDNDSNGYWQPIIISHIGNGIIEVIEPKAFDIPPILTMIVEEETFINTSSGTIARFVFKAKTK